MPREFCPAARWVFRCVRGKDTGHAVREEFECTAKVVGEDREISFAGVRVRQSLRDAAYSFRDSPLRSSSSSLFRHSISAGVGSAGALS